MTVDEAQAIFQRRKEKQADPDRGLIYEMMYRAERYLREVGEVNVPQVKWLDPADDDPSIIEIHYGDLSDPGWESDEPLRISLALLVDEGLMKEAIIAVKHAQEIEMVKRFIDTARHQIGRHQQEVAKWQQDLRKNQERLLDLEEEWPCDCKPTPDLSE